MRTTFDVIGHEVKESCSVTFQNNHYIFGGLDNQRQVLQVESCGLTAVGTLAFNHETGACASTGGLIVLCFDYTDYKQCRQSSSPLGPWTLMPASTYDHRSTSIATSRGTTSECRHLK